MYEYRCKVVDVYDGDTLTLDVDLGFNITHRIKVRLSEIDTPEVRGVEREDGLKAKDFVLQWVSNLESSALEAENDWPFIVHTSKTGKFGRWLADIVPNVAPATPSLVASLKQAGHDTGDWLDWV